MLQYPYLLARVGFNTATKIPSKFSQKFAKFWRIASTLQIRLPGRLEATGLAAERSLFGLCFASEDQSEGMAAFLEKREARFTGQ